MDKRRDNIRLTHAWVCPIKLDIAYSTSDIIAALAAVVPVASAKILCPDVFKIVDEGFATVIVDEIEENLIEYAEMAASGCPTDAIEIEKEA